MKGMAFKIGAFFGWGVMIYAVMFLLWSAFVTYGFVVGWVPRAVGLLVLVVVAMAAGRSLRANSWHDILPYSLAWGIMMAILDGVMSIPLIGWRVFSDPNVWFGYAVVIVAPLLTLYPRFRRYPVTGDPGR
jgi:hypothetical protein